MCIYTYMTFKVISQVKSNMKSLITKHFKTIFFFNLKLNHSFSQTLHYLFWTAVKALFMKLFFFNLNHNSNRNTKQTRKWFACLINQSVSKGILNIRVEPIMIFHYFPFIKFHSTKMSLIYSTSFNLILTKTK